MKFRGILLAAALPALLSAGLLGCASTGAPGDGPMARSGSGQVSPQAQAYAHYLAGILHERQGDSDAAREELAQTVDLDPEAITPLLELIRTHLRQRQYDEALDLCDRALALGEDEGSD